jgi:Mn2+/Fe2+ NRAMP family transporter
MNEDKKLKLMKFWLFGTFVILVVAISIYLGMFAGLSLFSEWRYWLVVVIAAVLSIGSFFLYQGLINKKK